jgi:hypothetical protein
MRRLSAIFISFQIGFFLRDFGVAGVFTFIAASMLVFDVVDRRVRTTHSRIGAGGHFSLRRRVF